MADNFASRFKRAFNVFRSKENNAREIGGSFGPSYYHRPHSFRSSGISREGIIVPIYTRISIDAAATEIRHVDVDVNKDYRYLSDRTSHLNNCLTLDPNIDQTSRAFFQSAVMSMCEEGVIAIVATKTTANPNFTDAYDVLEMRIGRVVTWYPQHVRVAIYNDENGLEEEVTIHKRAVAVVENPLYAVMNAPNSTLQRLLSKLHILDVVDEQSGSGKLDIILQMPYNVRHESRKTYAEDRVKDIEVQLKDSSRGIAYIDASEKITQLNRPVENNLMSQVEYLTNMLYGQLGITEEVLNGTADETTMINYFNRTIEPILTAMAQGMKRTFLSKTARSQGQSIEFYRDPFKLISLADFAEIADKLTRNEIMSSNEIRGSIGVKPSDDPKADELRNANLSAPKGDSDSTEAVDVGELEARPHISTEKRRKAKQLQITDGEGEKS